MTENLPVAFREKIAGFCSYIVRGVDRFRLAGARAGCTVVEELAGIDNGGSGRTVGSAVMEDDDGFTPERDNDGSFP
jgi:hypothetical protein